tara:strand:+ start:11966 stop:12763 length:798 start_codon:yes stop_codon:yes gene_type:complete
MRDFHGHDIPECWEDVSIDMYSKYGVAVEKFNSELDKAEEGEDSLTVTIREVELQASIFKTMSGINNEDLGSVDIGFISSYVEELSFLSEIRQTTELKSFVFEGELYEIPEKVNMNTQFGQYLEAMQVEMVFREAGEGSLDYLPIQLAHICMNGEDYHPKKRDILAEKFKELPITVGLDFAFFLSSQSLTYSKALQLYTEGIARKSEGYMKSILRRLVGLKRFMNLRKLMSLRSVGTALLTVLSVHLREKCSCIYRYFVREVTTK